MIFVVACSTKAGTFACWTSNPSLTYIPTPLKYFCETADFELTFLLPQSPSAEMTGVCHQIQLRISPYRFA